MMRRYKGSGRLRREAFGEEDVNPMDGVANLADVMLVLACGLMLALITYWNVDVTGVTGSIDVTNGQEVTADAEGFGTEADGESPDARYEEYGVVYRDPDTGKLYLVTEGEP